MSKRSNGHCADGPITGSRGKRHRALSTSPPPVERGVKTNPIEVRTKRAFHGGRFACWVDLNLCRLIVERPGDGIESDWQALYLTPRDRFLHAMYLARNEGRDEWYAVFITEQQAVGWFADDLESAPEIMRPSIEKFNFTMAPAAEPEPSTVRANAEKLLSALRQVEATDERSATQQGALRVQAGLTEREYREAIKLLKGENAVRTKSKVGTWLVS